MKNELLRLRALREYALEGVTNAERLCDEENYPAAAGYAIGVLKVLAVDAKYWIEEFVTEEQIARHG